MTHLNLFPLSYRRRQTVMLRLKQWSAVWVIALVTFGVLAWTKWSTYSAGFRRLNSLQELSTAVQETNHRVAHVSQIIDDMRQRESLVLKLADERSMFSLLGVFSRAARVCDGHVSIQDLIVQRRTQGDQPVNVITLNGLALDNQAVASFVDELRRVRAFQRVELKNSGIANRNNIESRTYSMECVF